MAGLELETTVGLRRQAMRGKPECFLQSLGSRDASVWVP